MSIKNRNYDTAAVPGPAARDPSPGSSSMSGVTLESPAQALAIAVHPRMVSISSLTGPVPSGSRMRWTTDGLRPAKITLGPAESSDLHGG